MTDLPGEIVYEPFGPRLEVLNRDFLTALKVVQHIGNIEDGSDAEKALGVLMDTYHGVMSITVEIIQKLSETAEALATTTRVFKEHLEDDIRREQSKN